MSEYSRVAEHLFIRKETGRYYAIIKKNNRIHRQSLQTKIREVANSKLFDFRISIGSAPSQVVRHRDIPTFERVVSEVVSLTQKRVAAGKTAEDTLTALKSHLTLASEKLGHLKISQIRPTQIQEYLNDRELQRSGRTVQVDVTHLRKVFSFAKDKGWVWGSPLTTVKRYKANTKKIHIPTKDDLVKVLHYLRSPECATGIDGKKAADFIEFLCMSGVRCQGAQTLGWEKIYFDREVFRVTEKGNKTREVNLFPDLRAWLEKRRQPQDLLFPPTHCIKKGSSHRYCPKKSLKTACEKTGVQRFTFHACRHYFATTCLETGISPSTVAGWLGHTDNGILVMRLYGNHMSKNHFAREADRVKIQF